jgi:hypothetical protein
MLNLAELGPNVPQGVLCLCPNHTRLFDCGVIYIGDGWQVRDLTTKRSADSNGTERTRSICSAPSIT